MRTRSSVEGISAARSRVWTTAWAVLLAMAMAVLLASCGESGAADTETADADTRAYDYGGFNEWDADNNDEVVEDEFYGGVYESWDEDDNGYVDSDEFEAGVGAYYEDYDYDEYGEYDEWDADNNDELDENEFEDSVADTGVYDDWDANGDDTINENEFDNQTSQS